MNKFIFAIFLLLIVFQLSAPSQTAPTKPLVVITLDKQTIRDDDTVQAQIQFSNEWDQNLSNVVLSIDAPPFLHWKDANCAEWKNNSYQEENNQPLVFGQIGAHKILSKKLCVKSDSDIVVGDHILVFNFEYSWIVQNNVQQSFLTIEKPLKTTFFGTDNIAGIPLALAGFIVPGLCFWVVVSWFKVPWLPFSSTDVALGERLIYSVLVSIIILILDSQTKVINISSGISLTKLANLAVIGASLGFALGITTRGLLYIIKNLENTKLEAAEKAKVRIDDSEQDLQKKLSLSDSVIHKPKATVELKNGKVFIGSLAKKETATGLIGWYKLSLSQQPENVKIQLRKLVQEGKWNQAFVLAHKNKIPIVLIDPIYELVSGEESITAEGFMKWENDQVADVDIEPDAHNREPLELEE
ncbi:MAG TPA: hypothetical protein VNB22_16230 [Pyrinomonadaceae bacterium]|nr:hypothetical protein [Pyrinomonadaceae bacterium]